MALLLRRPRHILCLVVLRNDLRRAFRVRPDGGYHMRSKAAAGIGVGVGVGSWCNNGLLGGLRIEPDRRGGSLRG